MRRRIITIAILFFSAVSFYYIYKLTNGYYNRSFYNIEISADVLEIIFKKNDEDKTFNVSLTNNSRKFITSADNVFLAYHIVGLGGEEILYEGTRHKIPDIKPYNRQDMIPLTVTNINKPGEYILQLDLVEEDVAWFSNKGSMMREIKLTIEG